MNGKDITNSTEGSNRQTRRAEASKTRRAKKKLTKLLKGGIGKELIPRMPVYGEKK